MESYVGSEYVDFHPDPPWDQYLSWGNFTHVANNYAYHSTPNVDASAAWVEFNIPVYAKSCLAHLLIWSTGGYCDVELVHANGARLWANRLQLYGQATSTTVPEGPRNEVASGRQVCSGFTYRVFQLFEYKLN